MHYVWFFLLMLIVFTMPYCCLLLRRLVSVYYLIGIHTKSSCFYISGALSVSDRVVLVVQVIYNKLYEILN